MAFPARNVRDISNLPVPGQVMWSIYGDKEFVITHGGMDYKVDQKGEPVPPTTNLPIFELTDKTRGVQSGWTSAFRNFLAVEV